MGSFQAIFHHNAFQAEKNCCVHFECNKTRIYSWSVLLRCHHWSLILPWQPPHLHGTRFTLNWQVLAASHYSVDPPKQQQQQQPYSAGVPWDPRPVSRGQRDNLYDEAEGRLWEVADWTVTERRREKQSDRITANLTVSSAVNHVTGCIQALLIDIEPQGKAMKIHC